MGPMGPMSDDSSYWFFMTCSAIAVGIVLGLIMGLA